MHYCDYHLHTEFSFDSREKMEKVCQKAVEIGIKEICFTEHVEFKAADAKDWPNFEKREEAINLCRNKYGDQLSILAGIESGQPQKAPDEEAELFKRHKFDFVIGSIHIVGDTGRPSHFAFNEQNYMDYFKQYFKESKELAEKSNYDVMGHVTFPFRYVSTELLKKYPIESFKKDYMELFDIIISRSKGIEINTSGLRTTLQSTMPNLQLVKWFRECGGKIITVGSDGHSVRSAFSGIEEGYKLLKKAGFEEVALFSDRRVCFQKV